MGSTDVFQTRGFGSDLAMGQAPNQLSAGSEPRGCPLRTVLFEAHVGRSPVANRRVPRRPSRSLLDDVQGEVVGERVIEAPQELDEVLAPITTVTLAVDLTGQAEQRRDVTVGDAGTLHRRYSGLGHHAARHGCTARPPSSVLPLTQMSSAWLAWQGGGAQPHDEGSLQGDPMQHRLVAPLLLFAVWSSNFTVAQSAPEAGVALVESASTLPRLPIANVHRLQTNAAFLYRGASTQPGARHAPSAIQDWSSEEGRAATRPTVEPYAAQDCHNWNTRHFYELAAPRDIEACLAAGADAQSPDARGNTPLHWAAGYNRAPETVRLLVHAGGVTHVRNRQGFQPLHLAAAHNQEPSVLRTLVELGADHRVADRSGRTALHLAAQYSANPKVVEELLSLGADLMSRDEKGVSVVDVAAERADPGVVEVLIGARRELFNSTLFDVTPLRDENRLFFNPPGLIPTGRRSLQLTRTTCRYQELQSYFPGSSYSPIGQCDATDSVTRGRDPVILEAQIAGDVALGGQRRVRALAFATERSRPGDRRRAAWQYYATMGIRLRMMRTTSVPVPPPSFMPKLTLQRLGFKKESEKRATVHITNLIVFGHHSNGQTGCPLENQPRRRDDGECLAVPQEQEPWDVNQVNGNFSTHYFEVGQHWRTVSLSGGELRSRTFGVGVQQHLPCVTGTDRLGRKKWGRFGTMCHVGKRYGKTRLWVAADTERVGYAIRMRFAWIPNGVRFPPVALELEYVKYLRELPDVYVRFYGGQDRYNIRFDDRQSRLEIGMAFAWEDALRVWERR